MNIEKHTVPVRLHDIAHARTGDKGNCVNISVIPYDARVYDTLCEQLTKEVVRSLFSHRPVTDVRRYELPNIHALNFVIEDVLEGGVNGSLNLDGHGKTLSSLMLSLKISIPRDLFDEMNKTN